MTERRTRTRKVKVEERRCKVCRRWFAPRRTDALMCEGRGCRMRAKRARDALAALR